MSFLANGRRFVPPRVKGVELLHYRLTSKTCLSMSQSDDVTGCILANQPHAELVLRCDATEFQTGGDEAQHYTIHSTPTCAISDAEHLLTNSSQL